MKSTPALGGAGRTVVAPVEAFHSSGRVDELLLASEEGVALRADLEPELLLGAAGDEGLATSTDHVDLFVPGMDFRFHLIVPVKGHSTTRCFLPAR